MGATVIAMKTRIQLVDSMEKTMKFIGGLYFPEFLPDSLVLLLARASQNEWTLVLDYGDLETGVSYSENIGTVGKVVVSKKSGPAALLTYFNEVPIKFNSILRVMSVSGEVLYSVGNYKRLYDWSTAQIKLSYDMSLIRSPFEILAYKANSLNGEFFMNQKVVAYRAESYNQALEFLDKKRKYEHA